MTKQEIVKNQILALAWNLSSDVIKDVANELATLHEKREAEVFLSIAQEDLDKLSELYGQLSSGLYDKNCLSTEVELPVKIKFVVNFEIEDDYENNEIHCKSYLYSYVRDDSRINVSDLYDSEAVKELPEIKELMKKKAALADEFKALIKKLAEKHHLEEYVIWNYVRNEL